MLLPTYLNTQQSPQQVTSPTWWQSLFQLGQEAIQRALPLPGEQQGGSPGVPPVGTQGTTDTSIVTQSVAGVPIWVVLVGALGAFVLLARR